MSGDFKNKILKRSYLYTISLVKFVDTLNKTDFSAQILAKQLLRSGTSIGANLVESQAASSKKDFANFLSYSLKSANETKFWLGLLRDTDKVDDKKKTAELLEETNAISKILGSSLATTKGLRKKPF